MRRFNKQQIYKLARKIGCFFTDKYSADDIKDFKIEYKNDDKYGRYIEEIKIETNDGKSRIMNCYESEYNFLIKHRLDGSKLMIDIEKELLE